MSKTRLELTWIGKEKRHKLEPRILLEDKELSYHAERKYSDDDIFDNRLIYGDNVLALKALEQEFTGKIKCIYIDPPYNTGSAFEHYDDGVEHSIWLSMMKIRLEILWNLLREDGSLWISIDDYEMPYLRILLDEICGRSSFVACNVWQKRYSRENRQAIGDVHEYILVYAKNVSAFKSIRNKIPPNEQQLKVYKNPNSDPKGPWRPVPMTAQAGHATSEQFYEVVTPSGKVHTPPEGRCWSVSKATYEKLLAEGRIYFGKNNDSQPNVIRYLSEVEGFVPWTWWNHEEVGHTDEAKKEIHALFGKEKAFDTPKPERLIKRILEIATNEGDLVLDSFAGTGTTGAVAHKMKRKWIMVELGNHCLTNIIPRLKKVINGEDHGGVTQPLNWQGGGGFRFYKLAPSLLEKDKYGNWIISKEYNPEMLSEAMCKLEGFTYSPDPNVYWKHGQSTENDYIYVTTQLVNQQLATDIADQMNEEESLLICCKAFNVKQDDFLNITFKKIPQMVLNKCEFGRDDYSLNVRQLPMIERETEQIELFGEGEIE